MQKVSIPSWIKWLKYLGVFTVIFGALDPMEGSILITIGAGLLFLHAKLMHASNFKIYFILFLSILFGVAALFIISSFGGLGPQNLNMWWGLLILPYPLGWLTLIIYLALQGIKSIKK
ncbi:MAG: hypothetical protein IPM51_13265 [Sphingobacteriaceae bacterium]|nr:hypothetical protein [Sphingobacteriaceae bacterium]